MISFTMHQARFDYRVAWVCVHEGHVLLQQAEYDPFWSLPGGRVEVLESSEAAIKREVQEELGLAKALKIKRLLWVVENFFTSNDRPNHELGFYYQVDFENQPAIYDKNTTFTATEEEGSRMLFRWFPLEALDQLHLYPTFLKTGLRNLPASVQHIVQKDAE
jgi:8-oxo-dGTP pyrophosphatase MutT (NUDIX family)